MRTAAELYHGHYAPVVVLSGGRGEGGIHEVDVMARSAQQLGIPPDALILDYEGDNTRRTVAHTGHRRVLAVSHFYHLARIKLLFRAADIAAFTVPARESRMLLKTPYFVAREVVAYWAYSLL
jgi:vancomycin permeability regulator SanA